MELIDRQQALEIKFSNAIVRRCAVYVRMDELVNKLNALPTVQPEPAIPLSWIEKHIEWHKSLDSEFANLAAAHISVMVKKWRDEQDETD